MFVTLVHILQLFLGCIICRQPSVLENKLTVAAFAEDSVVKKQVHTVLNLINGPRKKGMRYFSISRINTDKSLTEF